MQNIKERKSFKFIVVTFALIFGMVFMAPSMIQNANASQYTYRTATQKIYKDGSKYYLKVTWSKGKYKAKIEYRFNGRGVWLKTNTKATAGVYKRTVTKSVYNANKGTRKTNVRWDENPYV